MALRCSSSVTGRIGAAPERHHRTVTLHVPRAATTDALYTALREKVGDAELGVADGGGGGSGLSLQFAGKVLRRGLRLADYGLQSGSCVEQIGGLRGGMDNASNKSNDSAFNDEQVIKEGYMSKQSTGLFKHWQKRW